MLTCILSVPFSIADSLLVWDVDYTCYILCKTRLVAFYLHMDSVVRCQCLHIVQSYQEIASRDNTQVQLPSVCGFFLGWFSDFTSSEQHPGGVK